MIPEPDPNEPNGYFPIQTGRSVQTGVRVSFLDLAPCARTEWIVSGSWTGV